MSIVEEYNKNEADLLMKATELKTDTDQSKFNYKNCLKDELLLQHFVKSSPHFIALQCYLQDYVMTRLTGIETDIADIL